MFCIIRRNFWKSFPVKGILLTLFILGSAGLHAQIYHGAGVFAIQAGPDGTTSARAGDAVVHTMRFTNQDTARDTITVKEIVYTVFHPTPITNLFSAGTQVILSMGDATATNIANLISPNRKMTNVIVTLPVTMTNVGDTLTISFIDMVRVEDEGLPSGFLWADAVARYTDNHDAPGGSGIPQGFTNTFPTRTQVVPALGKLTYPYSFTTFAGSPQSGTADGVGSAAQFNLPADVALDADGNLFVADSANHAIRMVSQNGEVVTIAGLKGVPGSSDGTNNSARFNRPKAIALGPDGYLYVADQFNHTVRRIAKSGTNFVVQTIAGLPGVGGSGDGTHITARLTYPRGITIDASNSIYVTDRNAFVREIAPADGGWTVKTILSAAGYFAGVTTTQPGKMLLANYGSGAVQRGERFDMNWSFTEDFGIREESSVLTNVNARFSGPSKIVEDGLGNLYVTDTLNNRIRKISQVGTNWLASTFAGSDQQSGNADGTGTNALFSRPEGLTIDTLGNLYVADSLNNTIRHITPAGVVNTIAGPVSAGSINGNGSFARFNKPQGLVQDNLGNLFVADSANAAIRKITSSGLVTTIAGLPLHQGATDGAGNNARFMMPTAVAVDGAGNLYVTDRNTIRHITRAGVVSTVAGSNEDLGDYRNGTNTAARFNDLRGIVAGQPGVLFVADAGNHVIRQVQQLGSNWIVTTIAGSGRPGYADDLGTNSQFNFPTGITIDNSGDLFVTDTTNNVIRKLTWIGFEWRVSTHAGRPRTSGSNDGHSTNAQFHFPQGIVADKFGRLFVGDSSNHTIRMVDPSGFVHTIAGSAGLHGSSDSAGNDARFYSPTALAVDSVGYIYVADTANNTIRRGAFTHYVRANPVPYNRPPSNGSITIALLPPEANGKWRFPWELIWHSSGDNVSGLVQGDYPVEFRNSPGWLAAPSHVESVQVESGKTTLLYTNVYYPTLTSPSPSETTGNLTVNLGPTPPAGAGWRVLGDASPFKPSGTISNLPADTYIVEFAAVEGRVKPPNYAIEVIVGKPSVLSVNYLLGGPQPNGVALPKVVPSTQLTNLAEYPFGYNGQLISDAGYGSGVAVESNVVLTAAHLVFNDQELSYASRVFWFLQREKGVFEPRPLQSRAVYVLGGYASQRTNDLQSGLYGPGQSTPQSRNLDAAALYFDSPVANGSHGGYLPSDTFPNPWLTSTAQKMLVGYPLDSAFIGAEQIVPGRMYVTGPESYPLSISSAPVNKQQVYLASWLLSHPGNSGGPLYVNFNGGFYPAGIYLGTLYNGTQPYASVVRAIDSNVVNLITLAARLGDKGTNNDGGVIRIIPDQSISLKNPGYVQWQIGPPAAARAGAAWRLLGDPAYSTATNYTRRIDTTNAIVIEFKPINGWILPSNQTVLVYPNQLLLPHAHYTATNPLLVAKSHQAIGLSGTPGTQYTIETTAHITNVNMWLPFKTVTVGTGLSVVNLSPLTNSLPTFYRAVWITNF